MKFSARRAQRCLNPVNSTRRNWFCAVLLCGIVMPNTIFGAVQSGAVAIPLYDTYLSSSLGLRVTCTPFGHTSFLREAQTDAKERLRWQEPLLPLYFGQGQFTASLMVGAGVQSDVTYSVRIQKDSVALVDHRLLVRDTQTFDTHLSALSSQVFSLRDDTQPLTGYRIKFFINSAANRKVSPSQERFAFVNQLGSSPFQSASDQDWQEIAAGCILYEPDVRLTIRDLSGRVRHRQPLILSAQITDALSKQPLMNFPIYLIGEDSSTRLLGKSDPQGLLNIDIAQLVNLSQLTADRPAPFQIKTQLLSAGGQALAAAELPLRYWRVPENWESAVVEVASSKDIALAAGGDQSVTLALSADARKLTFYYPASETLATGALRRYQCFIVSDPLDTLKLAALQPDSARLIPVLGEGYQVLWFSADFRPTVVMENRGAAQTFRSVLVGKGGGTWQNLSLLSGQKVSVQL